MVPGLNAPTGSSDLPAGSAIVTSYGLAADMWSLPGARTGLSNAFARHLAVSGVNARDRVVVMTTSRVEFVGCRPRPSAKLGRVRRPPEGPAWKALEVGPRAGADRAGARRRRRAPPWLCCPIAYAGGVTDLERPRR